MGYQDITRVSYDGVVEQYASMFDNRLETLPFTRAMLTAFSELMRDTKNLRVADVGCGPGHMTAMLQELGLDATGYDLSGAMVKHAQQNHSGPHYAQATMESLPVKNGSFGGIVSHYSMIHTPPQELPTILTEQSRVLAPGGLLFVSFYATHNGSQPVGFEHAVAPAFSWPVDQFIGLLTAAGFDTFARLVHDPHWERPFLDAHLLARRIYHDGAVTQ